MKIHKLSIANFNSGAIEDEINKYLKENRIEEQNIINIESIKNTENTIIVIYEINTFEYRC